MMIKMKKCPSCKRISPNDEVELDFKGRMKFLNGNVLRIFFVCTTCGYEISEDFIRLEALKDMIELEEHIELVH